ncbi:MOSC domain-containing protein [Catenovulum adriaticum]|uniref:MOSC domain-containing protein n=1 Tax=Catenovulum adriaticum TaxID=2984846 RepID=A0ABY7AM05_9ALTE|nr:MOSC domain-containing protein [Catenovulum sp. TS8]WAJ70277.1 MOSC domain-containing protein [Catenovulum sp. TS8]
MIKAIFIAQQHKQVLSSVRTATCSAGLGIWGDRNFGKTKWPGQNITLIEAEAIEQFNQDYQQNIGWHSTRRNLVTMGISLNHLVGKRFKVGEVELLGVELCEPCQLLAKLLANETVSRAQVMSGFEFSGGLRAQILTDGNIKVGDRFQSLCLE